MMIVVFRFLAGDGSNAVVSASRANICGAARIARPPEKRKWNWEVCLKMKEISGGTELDNVLWPLYGSNLFLKRVTKATTIFHYTKIDNFYHILNDDKVRLWACQIDCMNDTEEEKDAARVFKDVCQELIKSKQIGKEFYDSVSQIKPERKAWISYNTEDSHKNEGIESTLEMSFENCEHFICCFSRNNDSLPMWNYYSQDGKYSGINVGFLVSSLQEELAKQQGEGYKAEIYDVIYEDEEKKNIIANVLTGLNKYYSEKTKVKINNVLKTTLDNWSTQFKNSHFKHEEEVRIIYHVPKESKEIEKEAHHIDIKFHIKAGMIVPYIEREFSKECVSDLTIGPLFGLDSKQTQQEIVEDILCKKGYHTKVVFSTVPVRF